MCIRDRLKRKFEVEKKEWQEKEEHLEKAIEEAQRKLALLEHRLEQSEEFREKETKKLREEYSELYQKARKVNESDLAALKENFTKTVSSIYQDFEQKLKAVNESSKETQKKMILLERENEELSKKVLQSEDLIRVEMGALKQLNESYKTRLFHEGEGRVRTKGASLSGTMSLGKF
eukprot:TRINITY_DN4403_c0_g1_i3.p1 TRINITY_DN4403_c0_g1~~TRINITY_DN4403_c0_g1_i3.p1  ORF type:complete len:196 (-),score=57.44 TRINITY_DN4403_c0_g1_i3:138-665(-)